MIKFLLARPLYAQSLSQHNKMKINIHISILKAFSLHLISKQCYPDQDVWRTNVNSSQYWSLFIVDVVLLMTNVTLPGDDLKTSLRLFVRSWILCIFCFHICVFVAIKIKFKPTLSVVQTKCSRRSQSGRFPS